MDSPLIQDEIYNTGMELISDNVNCIEPQSSMCQYISYNLVQDGNEYHLQQEQKGMIVYIEYRIELSYIFPILNHNYFFSSILFLNSAKFN